MSAPPYYAPGYYAPPPSRPIGVAILAVLTILIGVLILIAGVALLVFPLFLTPLGLPLVFGLTASAVGLIIILVSLLWIGTGVGLFHLRSWAWWLAVIVMLLSVLSAAASYALAILPLLILIYLIIVRKHFR